MTTETSPFGRQLMASDRNNFGPRFGFAYRPGFLGETVVRGGYGIYYTPQISNAIFAMAEGGAGDRRRIRHRQHRGVAESVLREPVHTGTVTTGAFNFAVSNDQNMRDSYIQQWNLNIQKKLPGNIVLDVGYVGSKGTDLIVTFGDLNRPIAARGSAHARTGVAQRAPSQSGVPARRDAPTSRSATRSIIRCRSRPSGAWRPA